MDVFARLERENAAYVASGRHRDLPVRPAAQLAIITCMDSRIPVFGVLGLPLGDAHIIRTAGARVTDDVLRSLALSNHALGTRNVALIGHTDCGLQDPDGTLERRLEEAMGRPPNAREWHAFADVRDSVAADCERLLAWDERPEGFTVAGYVLDVRTGRVDPVHPPTAAPAPR